MTGGTPQRDYPLREAFNAPRWLVRAGAPWRLLPNALPPWHTAYGQAIRWVTAGCIKAIAHDLRALLRAAQGRAGQPTPEGGARAGYCIRVAYVDQGYEGQQPTEAAQ